MIILNRQNAGFAWILFTLQIPVSISGDVWIVLNLLGIAVSRVLCWFGLHFYRQKASFTTHVFSFIYFHKDWVDFCAFAIFLCVYIFGLSYDIFGPLHVHFVNNLYLIWTVSWFVKKYRFVSHNLFNTDSQNCHVLRNAEYLDLFHTCLIGYILGQIHHILPKSGTQLMDRGVRFGPKIG